MSWEQYFGVQDLEKEKSEQLLKEVKLLTHRRDNMVARIASIYVTHKKHKGQRTDSWGSAA